MKRREFLQLAHTYRPGKDNINGHYISEKLDGSRCFWDGGLTRGMKTKDVPWASVTDPKTGKPKKKIKPIATGLWSRYGNPIMAPDWFLNSLPVCPLDGELWAGRGTFQLCRSICAGDTPDPRFNQIQFAVYSSPPLDKLFQDGEIKNSNFHCELRQAEIEEFVFNRMEHVPGFKYVQPGSTFDGELLFLRDNLETQSRCYLHRQVKLTGHDHVEQFLQDVLDQGGEGVILRDPGSYWTPKRHRGILKYKPYDDAEAKIIGFRAGKKGKQGNVLGKIGTLIVQTVSLKKNVTFEIGSGLTLLEREINDLKTSEWACENPGEVIPDPKGKMTHFDWGDIVTFKFRELSDDGVPKEARYFRKRNEC